MILYHGSTEERCENIIKLGHYEPGHKYNSNDESGLWCSDNIEMAKTYGECVIEIEVNKNDKRIQYYPIYPSVYDYYEEWMDYANEYCISIDVKFKAKMI